MSVKDFDILNKLGEGAYSVVYRVRRIQDNTEYALKRVKLTNLSEKQKQNALNEVRILASVQHPNIVGYKEAFLDESSNSLCIVMEYANNGDLYQMINQKIKANQTFDEPFIWDVFIQITRGLKALHQCKILHRDLKSANVFLSKNNVAKLGDMNVSKVARKGLCQTQTGTPYYASPEVWKDQAYDSKSDIWSLGCVLYEIITLKPPFRADDMEGLYKRVIRGLYPRIPSTFSQDLSTVIRSLLQTDPNLRPSCQKLLSLPVVMRHVNSNNTSEQNFYPQLLRTITIPKNLHYLTQKLPKPTYTKATKSNVMAASSLKQRLSSMESQQHLMNSYDSKNMVSVDYLKREHTERQEIIEKILNKNKKSLLLIKKRQAEMSLNPSKLSIEGHSPRRNHQYQPKILALVLPSIQSRQLSLQKKYQQQYIEQYQKNIRKPYHNPIHNANNNPGMKLRNKNRLHLQN